MKRSRLLAIAMTGVTTMCATAAIRPMPRLVYNASASAPLGWYRIEPVSRMAVGDYVVARLPAATLTLADARGYIPRSVPVLKQVAAITGQQVCEAAGEVRIGGGLVAQALARDGQGRPLAPWHACRRLMPGEVFLLNAGKSTSFDSRYFGPIDASFVLGRAIPVWTSP